MICSRRPIKDKMVSIDAVEHTQAVQVTNIGNFNENHLTLLLESPRNKGGPVESVEIHKDYNCAIVIFKDVEGKFTLLANHELNPDTSFKLTS